MDPTELSELAADLAVVHDESETDVIVVRNATPTQIVEPRPYQIRLRKNVLDAIDAGHTSILIEAPTGAGKTVIAHMLAKALHEKHGWRFGWTCMRTVLLQQAAAENARKFGYDFGCYFSTFSKHLPGGVDVLIEDEAQHSASATATAVYGSIKPKVHIALTATPFRTDCMKLCFSKVIRDAGLRQLIDEGWLSPFHQYMYDDVWSPENVSHLYLNDKARWGKSVIFFQTKAECYETQALLKQGGVESEVVIGGSLAKQQHQIDMFKRGEIDVLLNVYVLTEGFDCNDLRTVFLRPASKGPTQQMGGRALRPCKSKPFAQIVQNTFAPHPFHEFASPSDRWSMENGLWVSRESNHEKVRSISQKVMFSMAQKKPTELPKYIKLRANNFRRRDINTAGGGEPAPV